MLNQAVAVALQCGHTGSNPPGGNGPGGAGATTSISGSPYLFQVVVAVELVIHQAQVLEDQVELVAVEWFW